jgi:hypothetical protein
MASQGVTLSNYTFDQGIWQAVTAWHSNKSRGHHADDQQATSLMSYCSRVPAVAAYLVSGLPGDDELGNGRRCEPGGTVELSGPGTVSIHAAVRRIFPLRSLEAARKSLSVIATNG